MSLMADVERLKEAALPEVRETIAAKVSQYLNEGIFDRTETQIASEIIRLLSKDAEMRVRKTLSENLKNNPYLPRDVAVELAKDVLDVSLPVIEFSKVLTDEDLVEIIRGTQQVAKLTAISRREEVSELISDELVKTKEEDVVVTLFANKGASLADDTINNAVAEFKDNGGVIKTLINRGDLPIGVVEKMVNMISGDFKKLLVEKYQIDRSSASQTTEATREEVTLGLIEDDQQAVPAAERDPDELQRKYERISQLVNHLHKEGRLTHSIVLRALCEGNLLFFEIGLSRLAGIPSMNARTLIRDGNPEAFMSLCQKADMPSSTGQAMQVLVGFVVREFEAGREAGPDFPKRMVEYIIGNGYDRKIPLMPYLMALIGSHLKTEDIVQ